MTVLCRPCGRPLGTTSRVYPVKGGTIQVCADCSEAIKRRDLGVSIKPGDMLGEVLQCYGKNATHEGAWRC